MRPILASYPAQRLWIESDSGVSQEPREACEMVRIETAGGFALTLAAESLFGLRKRGGEPVLCGGFSLAGKSLGLGFLVQQFKKVPGTDSRLWFIAGLILANGLHNARRTSRFSVPSTHAELAEQIANFTTNFATNHGLRDANGKVWEVSIRHTGPVIEVNSRVFNLMLDDYLGGLLTPVAHSVNFDVLGGALKQHQRAFFAGVFTGSRTSDEGTLFVHRDSRVVSALHDHLFRVLHVATWLRINVNEPTVTAHVWRIRNPHSLLMPNNRLGVAQTRHLCYWSYPQTPEGESTPLPLEFTDPITAVTPVGLQPAVELHGTQDALVCGFRMAMEFEPNDLALEIASMDELFVDVRDPIGVLQRSPATTTHKYGEV